jgi:hypothetical protein
VAANNDNNDDRVRQEDDLFQAPSGAPSGVAIRLPPPLQGWVYYESAARPDSSMSGTSNTVALPPRSTHASQRATAVHRPASAAARNTNNNSTSSRRRQVRAGVIMVGGQRLDDVAAAAIRMGIRARRPPPAPRCGNCRRIGHEVASCIHPAADGIRLRLSMCNRSTHDGPEGCQLYSRWLSSREAIVHLLQHTQTGLTLSVEPTIRKSGCRLAFHGHRAFLAASKARILSVPTHGTLSGTETACQR